jgi:hypothetical protein
MLAVAPATAIRLWFLLSAYRADAICAFWAAPARWRSSDPGCFGVVASASPLRVNSCLRIMNRSPHASSAARVRLSVRRRRYTALRAGVNGPTPCAAPGTCLRSDRR